MSFEDAGGWVAVFGAAAFVRAYVRTGRRHWAIFAMVFLALAVSATRQVEIAGFGFRIAIGAP